jgi:hypothetical protein
VTTWQATALNTERAMSLFSASRGDFVLYVAVLGELIELGKGNIY